MLNGVSNLNLTFYVYLTIIVKKVLHWLIKEKIWILFLYHSSLLVYILSIIQKRLEIGPKMSKHGGARAFALFCILHCLFPSWLKSNFVKWQKLKIQEEPELKKTKICDWLVHLLWLHDDLRQTLGVDTDLTMTKKISFLSDYFTSSYYRGKETTRSEVP